MNLTIQYDNYDLASLQEERGRTVHEWALALKIFFLGFSGVFATLALLMVSIYISGALVRTITGS